MTAHPIHAYELLDLAYELAGLGAGRGKPKMEWLRRSISTSYYALFHELAYSAACLLCGEDGVAEPQRNRVVRWISHTDVLTLVQAVRDPKKPIAGVLLRPAPNLVRVGNTFVNLQERREQADYDYAFGVSRAVAVDSANLAEDAIGRARDMWNAEDESYLLFLRLMIGAVKIAKNR